MGISEEMIVAFSRMVSRDGGRLSVLDSTGETIRIGYEPGQAIDCDTDACVLPHVELQEMMGEWLERRAPGTTVSVQLTSQAGD